MATVNKTPLPWYRNPWPWFLMAFPAAAVIAGGITAWLAVTTSDGLVVDDYYKQGLAIEKTMQRSRHAAELVLQARVRLSADAVEIELTGKSAEVLPERVRVTFFHPTRSGMDQTLLLAGARGHFAGAHKDLSSGRWDIQIEDESRTWRLNGAAHLPTETEIRIVPVIPKHVE